MFMLVDVNRNIRSMAPPRMAGLSLKNKKKENNNGKKNQAYPGPKSPH